MAEIKWVRQARSKWIKYVTSKTLKNCLFSFIAFAMIPTAANAQNAPAADDPLGIPANISLLGEANPNVRTATAIVNGHVITGTDVDQRVALVTSASNNQLTEEELRRLQMQVLRNLIDETLQIQAAAAQEIEVTRAEVDDRYNTLAAQNFGQDPSAMDDYLISIGSSPASLKRQIEGELAWSNLLRRNISPFVNVSEEEVNEVLKRMEESRGTEEYRLGEIFLAATPENRNAVLENGQQIMQQLREGGSFVAYARQFSQASTAAVGGDLGFVRLGQLPPELASVAAGMQAGQLAGPIEIPGGFSILYLIDKRQVLMADPRDAVLSLKQISINFAPGITEEIAAQQVQTFATGVQNMRGCGDADAVAGSLGASVVTNDQIRARSLPEQLQNIVLNLQVGQSTPPFGSIEEGVRVLMLCGRDDPEVVGGPSFDQMMTQLEDERINKRAQRYLRDLRNDAYIDYN
ncbi:peptidyl-prolyl cis-trans isomerase SurA [Altererythrobacter ishigakiensis]|uniref:Parvulin-like PPIase n=2 Tax=Altererythrobacter ishigakiensis TaxID=476157 RepID=A0A562UMU6_9SPHN|nr:peptidyl-prolyl cis-trans isomerase SurA [Altererythrobacter ishigakiensis]